MMAFPSFEVSTSLKPCPDEEGIKTLVLLYFLQLYPFETLP